MIVGCVVVFLVDVGWDDFLGFRVGVVCFVGCECFFLFWWQAQVAVTLNHPSQPKHTPKNKQTTPKTTLVQFTFAASMLF